MTRVGWGARLTLAWRYVRRMEPARLRAIWAAAVLLVTTLGVTVPTSLDNRVVGVIGVLAVLIPLLQGEATRASVMPEAKAELLIEQARQQPAGYTDTGRG